MANRFYFGDDSAPPSQPPLLTTTTATTASSTDKDTSRVHPPKLRTRDPDSDSDTDIDHDTLTSLPFPQPLSRPTFTAPSFEPHAFLASLGVSNRFQTLEDLQTELRELSVTINRELVDLVNGNYEEFVSLGVELRGGEERVEEIRVGLLGFEKDVEGLRGRVVARKGEVEGLVARKRKLREETGVGRGLLELDERLGALEERVGLVGSRRMDKETEDGDAEGDEKWSDEWDDGSVEESGDEYDNDNEDEVPGRVRILVEQWMIVKLLVKKYDPKHPFVVSQKERVNKIHGRVLLEIDTAIKGAENFAVKQKLIQLKASVDV